MGKKGNWLSAVKKALNPSDSKEKKDKKSSKKSSKKYWFGKQRSVDKDSSQTDTTLVNPTEAENEQSKHAYSVAYATAMAAEAAVAAANAATEVVRLTSTTRLSTQELAAIKIQTAYRGHLARRALHALRGLGRLKSMVQGQSVKRQATSTLKCMQTLTRVQSEVRSRRVHMSKENKVVQQLLLKHEKELNIRSSLGDTWDDSRKSKEETEAGLKRKQEAAVRRERALAYAHSHQQMWKNSTKSPNPTFLDSNNPHWGWSWLERWMAARPWETQSITDKEPLVSHQSPSTPPTKARSSSSRFMPESQKGSVDGDAKSFYSVRSERVRWHDRAGSVGDDKSVESSPVVPSYMVATESAKARSRMASPVHSSSRFGSGRKGGSETGSAKKRISFSGSPARTPSRFTSN
ncbi:protein IQ-DOMAIN 3-like [Bidens hawaiensis]|uniref:protein IQ-DOMAIN 3-like n=1 Tax=Bidens hawaiensis TaxID=980011 RepID=UPI00404A34A9